ncbi:MAG: hypothetical protein QOF04_2299 [Solirubrobacteraceae bacterium]|nr:hypothetical protein [Solirubrobacteraceae bacterium]
MPRLTRLARGASTSLLLTAALILAGVPVASVRGGSAVAQVRATPAPTDSQAGGTSLEQAAEKAGDTGRTVALSLLGLALAIAAVILVFKRDFKEAAAIFGVGILGVVLATPAGLNVLNDLVAALFGQR